MPPAAAPPPWPSATAGSPPSATTRCATSIGPRTEVVDLAGRLLLPGFQDAHVHPVPAGLELGRCDLTGTSDGRTSTVAAIRAYADAHPGAGVDHRRRLVHGGLPRRHARPQRAARRGRARTGPSTCPTATTTAPGSTAAPWRSPASPATPPTRPTAGSSATPTGEPTGTLQEGAMQLVGGLSRAPPPADRLAALLRAQASSARATASPPGRTPRRRTSLGMDDPSDAYLTAARDGLAHRPRGRRPVVGPRARRRADPRTRRARGPR